MSAMFARVILGVGLGAVAAVLYTIFSSNQRHGHHGGGGGGYRPPRDDDDWGPGPGAWKDDDSPRPSRRKRSKKQEESQSAEEEVGNLKGCPICLDAWDSLKMKQIPVWTTQCGHLFCYPCLRQAIHSERGGPCPSCRKHVNMKNSHRVYI